MTTNRTEYMLKYQREKLKRVPLDLTKEKYQEVKAAADRAGSSVNGYIKTAIDEKIERDQECNDSTLETLKEREAGQYTDYPADMPIADILSENSACH